MRLKDDITRKVKEIMDTNFITEDVTHVPDIADPKLTFGNKGLMFEATVLHIDMRGSTKILNSHNKSTVGKIHMAYFHTIVKVAGSLGGYVRSFNGDSLLVFFPGTTKFSLNNAVRASMQMNYMITHKDSGINNLLSKYSAIDFGIGLDDGDILCTKIGIGGDSNNKGLFWAGNAVNKSVRLSDLAKAPNHICISEWVYKTLDDDLKYVEQETFFGLKQKVNMWTSYTFNYNGINQTYYYTSYYMFIH